MTRYVLGFAITADRHRIVLLQKNRGPGKMAGKINGLGGHIERGEAPAEAMERETNEELGVQLDWVPFCTMKSGDPWSGDDGPWICHCFVAEIDDATLAMLPPRTDVDETVHVLPIHGVATHPDAMLNLRWLIPMALEGDTLSADVDYAVGHRGDR